MESFCMTPHTFNKDVYEAVYEAGKKLFSSKSRSAPVEIVNCSHTWTIDKFSLCINKIQERLYSSNFSVVANDEIQWRLSCKLPDDHSTDLQICLLLLQPEAVSARFKISILNARCEEGIISGSNGNILEITKKSTYSTSIPKVALMDETRQMLPDDRLTIFCDVEVIQLSKVSALNPVEINIPSGGLSNDFRLLYENQTFSDVILSAGGHEFQAHKVILAARSRVFQAMFETKMEESKHNRVNITDVDHQVMRELVRFIYTEEVLNLEKMAEGLLAAADKYELGGLKLICEKELCSTLYTGNVVQMLILADLHSAVRLRAEALNFIKIHKMKIMDIPEWKDIHQHQHLVDEILRIV